MTINTTSIQNLLRPGLACVFGDYPMYPAQWTELYETYTSDKNFEQEVELKLLPLAAFRAEGAPTQFADMGQRYLTTYLHRYVGLGFQITRQAIMDNLYKDKFPIQARALKKSMLQTKDVLGAVPFNQGFNAAFPIGDGQAFFSLNHPIDTGVVANRPAVDVDLNEASLESGIIAIQRFRDQAGLLVNTKAKKLVVPTEGSFVACRLLESAFRTQTPNNDVSAIYNMSSVPEGYRVNQYLTLPNAWYLQTDAPDSTKHYIREKLETDVYTDFSTDSLLAKAIERYSFGVSNFRGWYASPGA